MNRELSAVRDNLVARTAREKILRAEAKDAVDMAFHRGRISAFEELANEAQITGPFSKLTTFNEYQAQATKFDIQCPTRGQLWFYAFGLCDEAGEVAGKVKKHYRDGTPLDDLAVVRELGDVLQYLTMVAHLLRYNLSDVARLNVEKRLKRGTMFGSGDDR